MTRVEKPRTPSSGLFGKTKMCKFKRLNLCTRGDNCTYAHNENELKPLPNLYKTKMCFEMTKNKHCQNPTCPYAHTKTELRNIAYKNSQMGDQRQRQDFSQGQGNDFYALKPSYWYPPSSSPWAQDANVLPLTNFALKPSNMGVNESPCSTGPMSLHAAFMPLKEDSDKCTSDPESTTLEPPTDTTVYDSQPESDEFDRGEDTEPEEMMGETPEMPALTWTDMQIKVKNTFLELSPTSKATGQFVSSRMFRCRSSPVFI